MDQVISSFFAAETLVYCIVIYLAVLAFRRGVEWIASKVAHVFPDKWEPWWIHGWRSVALPIIPFVFGVGIIILFPMYPVPAVFAVSLAGKMAFGLVCGGCSGFVYNFAKQQLKKIAEIKADPKE